MRDEVISAVTAAELAATIACSRYERTTRVIAVVGENRSLGEADGAGADARRGASRAAQNTHLQDPQGERASNPDRRIFSWIVSSRRRPGAFFLRRRVDRLTETESDEMADHQRVLGSQQHLPRAVG